MDCPGTIPTTIYNRFVLWARRGLWENMFRDLAGCGRSGDNAIADGLAGDEADFLRSLAAYQTAFRQKTMPVFEYTAKAAALGNPAPSLALYSKLAQSQTTRFMDVLAGTLAFKEYFAPSNISRLLSLGTRIATA